MKKAFVDSIDEMTSKNVSFLIIKNAIPTIITMMITSIYNTADTFFVSQLGTSASGAVGVIFSLMTIIQAGAFMIGMGSGSITSRLLGSGDKKNASIYCSTAIVFSFCVGIVFSIAGIIFSDSIVKALGATPTIFPYAKDYAHYIILACPFMVSSLVMNNQLRFQGRSAFSMIGMVTGGILNIILDPIFIFAFDLGISGAAIATFISQVVSFLILLSMFIFKKSSVEFSLKNISTKFSTYFNIITTGLPSLFRQGMASISGIFMNIFAAKYGQLFFEGGFLPFTKGLSFENISPLMCADAAVAGMSIANRISMLLLSVAIGLGQGFQPVCGINLGAKKYDRVKSAFSFLVKITTIIMTVFGVLVFIFSNKIAQSFRDDALVISMASGAMKYQACVLPLLSIIFGTNMLLQVAGVKKSAIFLSSLRQGLVFVPVILLLPLILKNFGFAPLLGIQLTPAVSDIISAFITIPFLIKFLNSLGKEKV